MSAVPATQTTQPQAPNAVTTVAKQVRNFIEKGTLHLPGDYSPENALKAAWLTLQEVQDRDNKPALSVCTQESIANALLDMVVQGLNPSKKQCYFIVYGKKLLCQRSYFGDQALAQRVRPDIEIYSDVVYEGDEFEFAKVRGRTVVTKHGSKLENQNPAKIKAAYCGIVDTKTGEDLGAEIMTMDQIRKSWGMSKTYNPGGNKGTHHDFPDQMAMRTVIRRRCKGLINASSDMLLLDAIRRQDEEQVDAEMDVEITEKANRETLSLNPPAEPVNLTVVETEKAETEPQKPSEPQQTLNAEDPGF